MGSLRTLLGRSSAGEPRNVLNQSQVSPETNYAVQVQLEDGSIVEAEVVIFARFGSPGVPDASYICLRINGNGEFEAESHNYFDALIKIRLELEPRKIKLLCYGARRDVWASGVQRDMGSGLNAYLLSAQGDGRKPASFIFEYASPETIGTVEEQKRYARA